MPLPRSLARFNKRVTNHVLRHLAGLPGPFAEISHRGRRSGRTYNTVIIAFRSGDGFLFPLTYGSSADWARNVMAAGEVRLRQGSGTLQLVRPTILRGPAVVGRLPPYVRFFLKIINADEVMVLERA